MNSFAHLSKQEQLERQLKLYTQENSRLAQTKLQYEQMVKQVKNEQRELDLKRKRDKEEIERMKEDEMLKIKKEKKMLE